MIYEQRIYRCIPGRLPALLARFENHTLKIWDKHGIKQAGFWTVLVGDGNHDLHYMLAWESLADRETKWNAFQADPASASHRARDQARYLSPDPALGAAVAVHQAWSGSLTTSETNAAAIAKFLELEPVRVS